MYYIYIIYIYIYIYILHIYIYKCISEKVICAISVAQLITILR